MVTDTHQEATMATRDDGGQKRATRSTQDADEVDEVDTSDVQERNEKLSDDVDDILDEIDTVLESNAEDFVRGFIQKGGQ
jgi:ubiquitin-like protein Pup